MKCGIINCLFAIALFLGMMACGSEKSTATEEQEIVFTDDLGREVRLSGTPTRVVSLAPSVTEMLFAMGAEQLLVSRTQACDYPEAVNKYPVVNTYPLDLEGIVALSPDLVLSVDGIVNPQQLDRLDQLGIPVFFYQYRNLADIDSGILTTGQLLDMEEQAVALVNNLQKRLSDIKTDNDNAPGVLMLTWMDPIFVHGQNTVFTDRIALAGGRNVVEEVFASPYPEVSREYLLKLDPDVIVGYDFNHLDSTFFVKYPELKRVKAYQRKQIFEVTDNLMSRPSPRYVESVIELKNILSQCE